MHDCVLEGWLQLGASGGRVSVLKVLGRPGKSPVGPSRRAPLDAPGRAGAPGPVGLWLDTDALRVDAPVEPREPVAVHDPEDLRRDVPPVDHRPHLACAESLEEPEG